MNEQEYEEFIKIWKEENKELINSGKCKKMFVEGLPKKGKLINWKNSIGYKIHFIYCDIEDDLEILEHISNKHPILKIKYKDDNLNIPTGDIKDCAIGRLLNKRTINFKVKIGETLKDDKRDLVILDREYRINKRNQKCKWYKYHCNKCNHEDWMIEHILLQGSGCNVCANQKLVVGINDIPTTSPWMVKYFKGGYEEAKNYMSRSNKKIYPICPDCGRVKNKSIQISTLNKYKSIGCNCSDGKSRISKYIYSLLEQLKSNFECEKKFDWCIFYNKYKEKNTYGLYDFVIDDMKLIIEADGAFHRKDNNMSGQTKEESIFIDNIKDRLAKENGYKVIRISDEGDFKNNILNSDLNKLFDLNNINWDECNNYSEKNLVKEICDYWHLHNDINNEELGIKDLSLVFNVGIRILNKYLKRGNKFGWCNYNPNDEKIKGVYKSIKKIGAYSLDGKLIKEFNGAGDLERKSKELFGFNMCRTSILLRANGKINKPFNNLIIKYID